MSKMLKGILILLVALILLTVAFKVIDLAIGFIIITIKILVPFALISLLILWILKIKKRRVFF